MTKQPVVRGDTICYNLPKHMARSSWEKRRQHPHVRGLAINAQDPESSSPRPVASNWQASHSTSSHQITVDTTNTKKHSMAMTPKMPTHPWIRGKHDKASESITSVGKRMSSRFFHTNRNLKQYFRGSYLRWNGISNNCWTANMFLKKSCLGYLGFQNSQPNMHCKQTASTRNT